MSFGIGRSFENQARKTLLEQGCPPCYPANFDLPLRNIPEEYEEIILYWGPHVLCAQLSDLENFREYQKKIRRLFPQQTSFSNFQDMIGDRRRKHKLKGDIHLHPVSDKQTQLENRIEFQNYHLHFHEGMQENVMDARKKLDAARKKLKTGGSRGAEDVEIFTGRVNHRETKLKRHEILLRWIEKIRVGLAVKQALPIDASGFQDDRSKTEEDKPRASPRCMTSARRKRDQKPHSSFGPVRSAVSKKPPSKRRNLRPRLCNTSKSIENANAEPSAPRRSKRIEDLRSKEPQRNEGSTPLRPFYFRSVSKAAKKPPPSRSCAKVKPLPSSRPHGIKKRNPAEYEQSKQRGPVQRPSFVRITRSGRVSRRPQRL